MPCTVAPPRARGLVVAATIILGGLVLPLPVNAADPPPPRNADRPNPDAAKINQANSRVIHAGPGTPLTGAIHVPPAQAKREKKSD